MKLTTLISRISRKLPLLVLATYCGSSAFPALADRPKVLLTSQSELKFGSFVVLGSGSRRVSATGAVSGTSIISTAHNDTGPARFTVSYDRGNNGRRNLNVVVQIVVSPVQQIQQGGITASLSSFDTDIPGVRRISPGQAVLVKMPNCRTRVCSRSFHIGGRIDVVRHYGGGGLTIPLLVDATLISIK